MNGCVIIIEYDLIPRIIRYYYMYRDFNSTTSITHKVLIHYITNDCVNTLTRKLLKSC